MVEYSCPGFTQFIVLGSRASCTLGVITIGVE